jgi:type IV pilus assembly protein PilM
MAVSVGIDFGAAAAKVIVGRKNGPLFSVQRALHLPLDDRELEGALKGALGKAPGARFSLSGEDLIIRYVQVPPVPLWRLKLLMDLEVQSMSEKSQDELLHDFNVLGPLGNDDETVLLSVVRAHLLEERFASLQRAVGAPRSGMPSSVALFNAYAHCGEFVEDEVTLLVDLGEESTDLVFLREGELLFARNLNVGGRALTDAIAQTFSCSEEDAERLKLECGNAAPRGAAQYASGREEKVAQALAAPVGQLASMLQSSLGFARAQTGLQDLQPQRVFLTGGGANLRGLDLYLGNTFGTTVDRFLPDSGLDLSGLPPQEADAFEADPGSFATAIGLAVTGLGENSFALDLVPPKVTKRRAFFQRTVWMIAAAVVVIGMIFIHSRGLHAQAEEKARVGSKARKEASRISRLLARDEKARQAIRRADAAEAEYARWTGAGRLLLCVQGILQRNASPEIWVQDLRVSGEAEPVVTIEGVVAGESPRPDLVFQTLMTRLRAAGAAREGGEALDWQEKPEEVKKNRTLPFRILVRVAQPTPAEETRP